MLNQKMVARSTSTPRIATSHPPRQSPDRLPDGALAHSPEARRTEIRRKALRSSGIAGADLDSRVSGALPFGRRGDAKCPIH